MPLPTWQILVMVVTTVKMDLAQVDIRQAFLSRAECNGMGLSNLHYILANVNATGTLGSIFDSLPNGAVRCVTICHPDPHYKKSHHKRRMVEPGMVKVLADNLLVGGSVHVQTDVEELAVYMQDVFSGESRLKPVKVDLPVEHDFGERLPSDRGQQVCSVRVVGVLVFPIHPTFIDYSCRY